MKRKYIKTSLHPSILYALPLSKISYTNSPPKYKTTIKNPKLLPLFVMNDKGQVTERFLEKDREKEQGKPCMPVGG